MTMGEARRHRRGAAGAERRTRRKAHRAERKRRASADVLRRVAMERAQADPLWSQVLAKMGIQ